MPTLSVRPHEARDYEALPDIDSFGGAPLSESDTECLRELGKCLLGSDSYRRLGISLLHYHFPIRDDERLVMRADHRRREINSMPEPIDCLKELMAPITLQFESVTNAIEMIGLEYAPASQFTTCEPLGNSDTTILQSLRRVLHHYRCLTTFGVRMMTNDFNLTDDYRMVETCDKGGRTLRCTVFSNHDDEVRRTIETVWYWRPKTTDTPPDPRLDCVWGSCSQSCSQSCMPDSSYYHNTSHSSSHTDSHTVR